jgi:hypothetical protein
VVSSAVVGEGDARSVPGRRAQTGNAGIRRRSHAHSAQRDQQRGWVRCQRHRAVVTPAMTGSFLVLTPLDHGVNGAGARDGHEIRRVAPAEQGLKFGRRKPRGPVSGRGDARLRDERPHRAFDTP